MGLVHPFISSSFPPASNFSVNDIPDLNGKIAIVTGVNTGIGKETVKALLACNAKVYILTRNREKSEHAIAELKELTGHEAHHISCDLSDLRLIKVAAEEFLSKEKMLHILINNAGVMAPPMDDLTAQGYDMMLGTNALGHFYLTKLLLPTLLSTVKQSGQQVRLVTLSSMGHHLGNIDFNTFTDTPARRQRYSFSLYGQSKSANIVFAVELARRYADQGIISVSVHPGSIRSELHRHMPPLVEKCILFFLYSSSQGALTSLYAATSPEVEQLNGKYFVPWARLGDPEKNTQDPELGRKFWVWCDEQVKDI